MSTKQRILLGGTTLAMIGLAMGPGTALAHYPSATGSCEGLTLSMTEYPGPDTPNHVLVMIDGEVALQTDFGPTYSNFISWSSTVDHEWHVTVDGLTDDGDAVMTGMHEACETTTTMEEETTTTMEEETTTTMEGETTTTMEGETGTTAVSSGGGDTETTVASEGPIVPNSVSPEGGDSAGAGGELPATGSSMPGATAALAAALAVAGTLLAVGATRRKSMSADNA